MGKIRGFLLKARIHTVFWCSTRRRSRSSKSYGHLDSPSAARLISTRLFRWSGKLKSKVKAVCSESRNFGSCLVTDRGYKQIEQDPIVEKREKPTVPKGLMAVYVGQKDGGFERVLVPVIYFNHPLFGSLLHDAEEEFGFYHPGAITIPCRISEFEHVQTRIKEGRDTRKFLMWK